MGRRQYKPQSNWRTYEMGHFWLGEEKGTGPMPEKGEEHEKDQAELSAGKRQMG
jgi:hypothetical protein